MDAADVSRLDFETFYGEWSGHRLIDLKTLYASVAFREDGTRRRVIWLAGDSSLDNKYWVLNRQRYEPCNGYERVLPYCVGDVAYWINKILSDRAESKELDFVCINCSVEATTLGSRIGWTGRLKPQDIFLRDSLKDDDILVASVGGNDIALAPSFKTIMSLIGVLKFGNAQSIKERGSGCGTSHLMRLFKNGVECYLGKLIAKTVPNTIAPCTIYYLDENAKSPSWANTSLSILGYDKNPSTIQTLIDAIYLHATARIEVDGAHIVPVELSKALNGKHTRDYECRVEPSVRGGKRWHRSFSSHSTCYAPLQ